MKIEYGFASGNWLELSTLHDGPMHIARHFTATLLNRWRNLFSRSKKLSSRPEHVRGRKGEDAACRFLRKRGYKVLYRNFKHRAGGEVDVVCRDGETLVFVEVKTRANEDARRPLDDIKSFQKRQIERGAQVWLRMLDNPEITYRFDVVEVHRRRRTQTALRTGPERISGAQQAVKLVVAGGISEAEMTSVDCRENRRCNK